MPILKARIIQEPNTHIPTEAYGDHVWEGILEPYAPTYSVLVQAVRGVYERLCLDYARFGEEWNGLTVPVSFAANERGGGMFSFVLSQPITPFFLNQSFLTCYMLLNVQGGGLTDYLANAYDVFQNATRTVVGYDELCVDRTGDWGLMEYDITGWDQIGLDPNNDGHAGADWYDVSYAEQPGFGTEDFTKALPLRMPTTEPWEWENSLESGTVERCPSINLTRISINLQITTDLIQHANEGTGSIWVRVGLYSFQGSWVNSTVLIDLSGIEYSFNTEIEYNLTDFTLWDGLEYKQNEGYQQGIVSSPYLTVEIYDADPNRYFLETASRYITSSQTNQFAAYLPLIQDQRRQLTFRQEHLLDSTVLGMNVQTDTDYLAVYRDKIDAYQDWIEEQNELAKIENWGFEQWGRFIFAIGTAIISLVDVIWGDKVTGVMGLTLAIDQIQSMFTQQSMFSAVIAPIVVAVKGAEEGWTAEQKQEQMQRFNVWTPFSRTKDAMSSFLNSMWSTLLTIAMIYGPKMIGGLFKSASKAAMGAADDVIKTYKHTAITKGFGAADDMIDGVITKVLDGVDDALKAATKQVINKGIAAVRNSKFYQAVHYAYKGVYYVKQFFGGFISPTEWIEMGVSALTCSMWGGFTFSHHPKWTFVANFAWNWGDNFYFAWLEQETTMGLFYWLGAAAQGDFVGATIWDNSSPY